MGDKIKTCKPSLITSRPDFNYRFDYTDQSGAVWEFGLHTMTAKQRGASSASLMIIEQNADNKPQIKQETNNELYVTAVIFNALDTWNLEDVAVTVANIDLLPSDVRLALFKCINTHENDNDSTLESEIKN